MSELISIAPSEMPVAVPAYVGRWKPFTYAIALEIYATGAEPSSEEWHGTRTVPEDVFGQPVISTGFTYQQGMFPDGTAAVWGVRNGVWIAFRVEIDGQSYGDDGRDHYHPTEPPADIGRFNPHTYAIANAIKASGGRPSSEEWSVGNFIFQEASYNDGAPPAIFGVERGVWTPFRVIDDETIVYSPALPDSKPEEFAYGSEPIPGAKAGQQFGANPDDYDQFYGPDVGHMGVDFPVPTGTAVLAVQDGVVTRANDEHRESAENGGHNFGYHVYIEHAFGYSTVYAHLDRVDVELGDRVKAGHPIGLSGNTGNSSGPHLHFAEKLTGSTEYPREFSNPTERLAAAKRLPLVMRAGDTVHGWGWGHQIDVRNDDLGVTSGSFNLRENPTSKSKLLGGVPISKVVRIVGDRQNGYYPVEVRIRDVNDLSFVEQRAKLLDVSHHNGIVPFDAAKKQGVRGVYIKAGQIKEDTQFRGNVSRALAAGLYVGAYWYVDARTDPKIAANDFNALLSLYNWDLPPAIDVEDNAQYGPRPSLGWLRIFFEELRRLYGDRPLVIYTNAYQYNPVSRDETFGCLLWNAAHGASEPLVLPDAWSAEGADWWLWQDSKTYRVSGHGADLDHNLFRGSEGELEVFVQEYRETLTAQLVEPVAVPVVEFKRGIHGRADRHDQVSDHDVFKLGQFDAIKVQSGVTVAEVRGYGAELIVCRLFESWNGRDITTEQFLSSSVIDDFRRLYDAGVRYVELCNEPNLTHEGLKTDSIDGSWRNGTEFGEWFVEVATSLRDLFPGIRVGFPAMSPGGAGPYAFGHDSGWRYDEMQFINESAFAMVSADWLALHSYYADAHEIETEMTRIAQYVETFNLETMITEFSCPMPPDMVSNRLKGELAKLYYERVSTLPNVSAAFYFIVSGHGWEWQALRDEQGRSTGIVEYMV